MKKIRDLLPWEARCGCPSCRVRPGERCKTLSTRYPDGYRFRDGTPALGRPTTAHQGRYKLWCYLWGRQLCTVGAVPSAADTVWGTP